MEEEWTTVTKLKTVKKEKTEFNPSYTQDKNVTILQKHVKSVNPHNPSGTPKGIGKTHIEDQDYMPKTFGSIGRKIEAARAQKKITRNDLAIKMNMTIGQISDIETGKAVYNGQVLAKINKILGSQIKK